MGIHVHVKGQPDNCGCCALKEKLDTLWNRASGSVTVINGVYPDADGHITVDLLQEAAVQSIIEDYIEPMQDNLDAMNTRLDGYAHVFDDYAAIVQAVSVTLPGEIDDVQDYAEAIADDLLQNYLTKQIIQSTYATKAEIQGLATRQDIQNVINGYVFKNGTATPQVISGTGGLQIAGDLAVGGDITASDNTTLHFDNVDLMEIAGMTVRKDGGITRLFNTNGLSINGLYMSDMVSTIKTAIQSMRGPLEVPVLSAGAGSLTVVNKQYVSATDGITNNLVHTNGDETVNGVKKFITNTHKQIPASSVRPNNILSWRPAQYQGNYPLMIRDANGQDVIRHRLDFTNNTVANGFQIYLENNQGTRKSALLSVSCNHRTGACVLLVTTTTGAQITLANWTDETLKDVVQ